MSFYLLISLWGTPPLTPLIPHWRRQSPRNLTPSKERAAAVRGESAIWPPNLVWTGSSLMCVCVCVSLWVEKMLTAHHNPFIPIPHHAWLHRSSQTIPGSPSEARPQDTDELLERIDTRGAWWVISYIPADEECTQRPRVNRVMKTPHKNVCQWVTERGEVSWCN